MKLHVVEAVGAGPFRKYLIVEHGSVVPVSVFPIVCSGPGYSVPTLVQI
jgi:hypothetical protein